MQATKLKLDRLSKLLREAGYSRIRNYSRARNSGCQKFELPSERNTVWQVKEIQHGKENSADTFHFICMGKIDHCLSQIFTYI